MRRRIRFGRPLAALALLLVLAADPRTAAEAAERLVIVNAARALTFVPLYVAEKAGSFRDEGLDVELVLVRGGAQARAAVVGGSAAVGVVPPDEIAQAVAAGQPLLYFASIVNEYSHALLVHKDFAREKGVDPQSPLQDRIRALRNARLSVTSPGSMTDRGIRFILRSGGIDPDREASIVGMGGDVSPALGALERRAIEGVVHEVGTLEMAESMGKGVVLISGLRREIPELRGLLFTGLFTTRRFAEANHELLVRTVRALRRALQLIHGDTARARAMAHAYFPEIPAPIFERGWDRMLGVWPKEPTVTRDGIQVAINFYDLTAPKPLRLRYEDFATNRYVEEAQK